MTDALKQKLIYISIAVAAIFIIFIWPTTSTWDGDGMVNVFPASDSAKNYRLDATMEVTRHKNGWINSKDEYLITRATWPNGGYLEFSNCIISQDTRAKCANQDGIDYYIEVNSYPEEPEDDTNN